LLLTALWLCRRLIFTGQIPAGTDAFDLVARAQQNAHWGVLLSPWSPTGLGSTRQVSLDNLLGLLVILTGDAARTVAFLLAAVLLASGVSAYWVVRRWYGHRAVGTIAGLIYMTSQASIGRVASGWLHYELLIALAPILIHLWFSVVEKFDPARALWLAVGLAAIAFARQDVVLWLAPAFVVAALAHLISARSRRRAAANVAKASALVLATVGVLNLYFIVPLLGGIRAPWVTTGQVFEAIRFNLLDRSLDSYQSFLGLGRDMGYLPFNGESWWNFHPWFPLPIYYELQALVVAGAIAALWFRRDTRTIFLVLLAIVATFLGKGIRGPFGDAYWLGVEHVPVFGSLRGPNRWLIEQSFCYATLFAVTLRELQRRLARRLGTVRAAAGLAIVGVIALLPVGPTLLHGFRTWTPTPAQDTLMASLAREPGAFSVATVPYDQSMRYMSSPPYNGWEHDLGVESSLFTGHSALSTNSWDQRGSDFVDYTASLLEHRDPAFARLLGSVGVGYLVRFDYPSEAASEDGHPASLIQQHDLARQPDAKPVLQTTGGTVYRDAAAAPFLSFRTNLAVVLGGRSGIAAFADRPGITLRDWAVQTADDLLAGSASPLALTRAMNRADTIIISDSSVRDLGVLATRPIARLPGITSDPRLDRRGGLLLDDESGHLGSLADSTVAPPALASTSRTTFHLPRPATVELWTRILYIHDAGNVTFAVDGRQLRSLLPLESGSGRFAWVDVGRIHLGAGGHSLDVSGAPSAFGASFELDESRVVDPAVLAHNISTIQSAVKQNAQKIDYVFSLAGGPYARQRKDAVPGEWTPQAPKGLLSHTRGTQRAFDLVGARPFYTFATRTFAKPQSWSGRSYAVLTYWSSGAGTNYQLLFDFDSRHTVFQSYPLADTSAGWHTAAVPLTSAWKHVIGLRVSTKNKDDRGRIVLGQVRLLFSPWLVKTVPLPTAPGGRIEVDGASRNVRAHIVRSGRQTSLAVHFPRRLVGGDTRVWVLSAQTKSAAPAIPVTFRPDGNARFSYSFHAPRRGMLVLAQSADKHWQAAELAGGNHPATPVMSLVSGFVLGRGVHAGFVEYRGARLVSLGVALSIAALVATLVAAVLFARRRRTDGHGGVELASSMSYDVPTPSGAVLERSMLAGFALICAAMLSAALAAVAVLLSVVMWRAAWTRLVVVAVFLTLLSPLLVALGRDGAADALSVAICLAVAAAAIRLLRDRRRVGPG
jgi:hypothetical protein